MGEIDLGIEGLSEFREIGSGGFATVYTAFELDQGRTVAVKVLDTIGDGGRRRFDRERLTMGRTTDHPNIVTLFRSGYSSRDEKPFLVMEYLAGGSLQDRIAKQGAMSWSDAVALIRPIADALHFSHGAGIVHKDVKPANILLSASGVVKLSDFGIAAVKEATVTSQVAYSLAYTPPETFDVPDGPDGGRAVDPRDERSDLYSLATALYAVGAGRPPFRGPTSASLMRQILDDPPPSTGQPGLDAFLAVALAKDPDERYQTATEFLNALNEVKVLDEVATPSARVSPSNQSAQTGATGRQPKRQPVERPTIGGRWYVVAAALPLLVAGLLYLTLVRRDGTPEEATASTLSAEPATAGAPGAAIEPVIYTGHSEPVLGLLELSDGRIASASFDGTVQVWDPASPGAAALTYTGHGRGAVAAVVELSDGRIASASFDNTVQIWDPADPTTTQVTYTGHVNNVVALAELGDGRIASAGMDGTVQVWDPAVPVIAQVTYEGHRRAVTAVVELDNGRIASASEDGSVQIWDPIDPPATLTYSGHQDDVKAIVELGDSRIASAGIDRTVQVWDPTGSGLTEVTYTGHSDRVRAVAELANGRIASAGEDTTVHVWDSFDPAAVEYVYVGHAESVLAVIELRDGRIASAGEDSLVHIWNPTDG